ncbi:hypothetical protein [Butyrivibrio sp. VCB2006]|uniref:hypothetical protein n=1 Tax=Butyrivibrio sp. VCB2006 TaxID=1280679 RepID=UPI000419567B|nr:hypothetical protein [Butyrivibrio sp. VCB2006]
MGPIGIAPELKRKGYGKELIPGYLDGITGVYQTPKGYYVEDADVEEFDKNFPPKEKLKLPGQIFE